MKNEDLAKDYVERCRGRIEAIGVLHRGKFWADVVRESQEAVELALKAVLRAAAIDPPRIHDVSDILLKNEKQMPEVIRKNLAFIAKLSRSLRRDREMAFYGTEDLTPSEFYKKEDADEAYAGAKKVVEWARQAVLGK